MQIKVDKTAEKMRLDNFSKEEFFEEFYLVQKEELTRSQVQKYIETGKITVNGKEKKSSYKLKENDVINFVIEEKKEEVLTKADIPLDILYEDDFLIVLNKQKNLLVHPTSKNEQDTLVNALLYHTKNLSDIEGKRRQGIVHRLDKNTSGLMLAAKTNDAHIKLKEDIKQKKTIRKYLLVCYGVIENDFGTIDKPLVHYLDKTVKMNTKDEGLYAVTHYRVLERFECATFLEARLETGRTHQIRCHFASINHPLINDTLYGANAFKKGVLKNLKTQEQVLMSYYLSFTHPNSFEIMEFELKEEKYHPDLIKTLNILRSKN